MELPHREGSFVNAIVSVLQVGVTLMLYSVFKLEAVCPLGSAYPCCGLGPWAGLERAEGNGLCAPDLASVLPLQQKGRWTARCRPLIQLAALP